MKLQETAKAGLKNISLTLIIRIALVLSTTRTWHYSMKQSCGSSVLANGRLADLIRRVATFGMVLMKLDVRQVYTDENCSCFCLLSFYCSFFLRIFYCSY